MENNKNLAGETAAETVKDDDEDDNPISNCLTKANFSTNGIAGKQCTVCCLNFSTSQECLKHELLFHSIAEKRPRKTLRNKLNAILKSLNKDEKQVLHTQVRETLQKCAAGQEMVTICKFHRVNTENIEMVYTRVHNCLKQELRGIGQFNIYGFGSVASGLALRDCDIDIYIDTNCNSTAEEQTPQTSRSQYQRKVYNKVNVLLRRSHCFNDVYAIRQARVPIIKCLHTPTGFSLDINLCCPSSVQNTNFMRDLLQCDARIHELMLFLKIWSKQLQIIGRGNMTSYCLITLIIFYLQQPLELANNIIVLPAIQELQENEPPNMVMGVNYAYNFATHKPNLPADVSVITLIKGFFNYYNKFAFERYIIAPYLGATISLEQFKSGTYNYVTYENQLRAMKILNNAPAEPLQVERCICVQDPFCLNHNVAKSIAMVNLDYIRKCIQHAEHICQDTDIENDAQLFDALLYGIIEEITRSTNLAMVQSNQVSRAPDALKNRFVACRAELRTLAALYCENNVDKKTLDYLWVRYYIDAITEIITNIYKVEMLSTSPIHRDKQQRLEHATLSRTWLISATVDMWRGRNHQKITNKTFMEYQLAQTAEFQNTRRQDASYAIELSGILIMNINSDYTAIELTATQRRDDNVTSANNANMGIIRKDPMRKFFALLKCSMQNFNLKEYLHTRKLAGQLLNIEEVRMEMQQIESDAALNATN